MRPRLKTGLRTFALSAVVINGLRCGVNHLLPVRVCVAVNPERRLLLFLGPHEEYHPASLGVEAKSSAFRSNPKVGHVVHAVLPPGEAVADDHNPGARELARCLAVGIVHNNIAMPLIYQAEQCQRHRVIRVSSRSPCSGAAIIIPRG